MRGGLIAFSMGIVFSVMAPFGAYAQGAVQDCAATPATLPSELSGWTSRKPITVAAEASTLGAATLAIGQAADATLQSTKVVRYITRPERPGGSVSYGGIARLDIDQAGIYRVALSTAAWIDMLRGKSAVTSTAHGHGPDCSGIRKMVDFALEPGRYTLQVAANGAPALALMVVRLP